MLVCTSYPQLGFWVGKLLANIIQGIATRWLLLLELLIRGFQESFYNFFADTYYKWSYWLATGSWPISVGNATYGWVGEGGGETPNAFGFMLGVVLLWMYRTAAPVPQGQ